MRLLIFQNGYMLLKTAVLQSRQTKKSKSFVKKKNKKLKMLVVKTNILSFFLMKVQMCLIDPVLVIFLFHEFYLLTELAHFFATNRTNCS